MYQIRFPVRYSEVDQKGYLTIVAMINYMQDASSFHSDAIGFGLPYLTKRGQGWFITSWQIRVHSLPKYGEEIVIKTWPERFQGVIAHRDYVIENTNGERLVETKSLWVLMDLKTNHPQRIPREILDAYGSGETLGGEWAKRKILLLEDAYFEKLPNAIEVMPAHLDTNRHMNNAYYIEFARDVLAKDKKVYWIQTEYRRAAMLSDRLFIKKAEKGSQTQVVLSDEQDEIYAIVDFR